MMAGVLYGISKSALWETRLLGLFILALMPLLEFALSRFAACQQLRELNALL